MKNYTITNLNKIKNNSTLLTKDEAEQASLGAILFSPHPTRKVLIAIEGNNLKSFDSENESAAVTKHINEHPQVKFYWTTQAVINSFCTPDATAKLTQAAAGTTDVKVDITDAKSALLPKAKPKSSLTPREILSWIGTFIEAELNAFSWPSFIAWVIRRIDKNENLSPQQNALATAIIWQIMALFELGIQYYLNIPRASGEKDPAIKSVEGENDARFATFGITLSVISQILGGIIAMLAINLAAADAELFGYLVLGFLVGCTQALAFLMSDAQTLWLSFMASKPEHERIKHITRQPGLRRLFANAEKIALVGRELYPPLMAGLGSYFVYCLGEITATELGFTEKDKTRLLETISSFLPLVYQGSAAVHRKFDVYNMIKGLEAINIIIEEIPYLMRKERHPLVRYLGYILYGQAMANAIIKLGELFSTGKNTAVKIASIVELLFHATTTYAQTYRESVAYVASSDSNAVEQNKAGLLLSLYVQNPARELDIAHILVHVLKLLAAKVTATHFSTRYTTILRATRTEAGLDPTPAPTPLHGATPATALSPHTPLLPPAQRPRGENKSAVVAKTWSPLIGVSTARAVPGKAVPLPQKGVASMAGFSGPRTPTAETAAGTPLTHLASLPSLSTPP